MEAFAIRSSPICIQRIFAGELALVASNSRISPRAKLENRKQFFALTIPQVTSRDYVELHSRCCSTVDTGEGVGGKWNVDEQAARLEKSSCSLPAGTRRNRVGVYNGISMSYVGHVCTNSSNRSDIDTFVRNSRDSWTGCLGNVPRMRKNAKAHFTLHT